MERSVVVAPLALASCIVQKSIIGLGVYSELDDCRGDGAEDLRPDEE